MRSFTSALVGAAVATIVVSGSIAIAAIPDSSTKVITGCYKKTTGELRVIDKTAKGAQGACNAKTEVELGWNQQGVKGDPGIAGLSGLPGKDGSGAPVMRDATGAVVGTPLYPTIDMFWTGQGAVKYDLLTGKVVRSSDSILGSAVNTPANVYLAAGCTGKAFSYHDIPFAEGYFPLAPSGLTDVPQLHVGNDLTTGVLTSGPTFWVLFVGVQNGAGLYDPQQPLIGGIRVGVLPYQLDASGVCAPLTAPGSAFGWIGADEQPVTLTGLRDFTGPITRTLVPMPG